MRKYPVLSFFAAGYLILAGSGCAYKEIGPVRAYVETKPVGQIADPKIDSPQRYVIDDPLDAKIRGDYENYLKTEWEGAQADFQDKKYFAASFHLQTLKYYAERLHQNLPDGFENLEKENESCLEKLRMKK